MYTNKSIKNHNPRKSANCVSIILWWWTVQLFKKGFTKILHEEDLYEPLKTDYSCRLGDRLEARWMHELQVAKQRNRQPTLLKAIVRTFFLEYFLLGVLGLFSEVLLPLASPLFLGSLLGYFKPEATTTYEMAIFFAVGIMSAQLLRAVTFSHFSFGVNHAGGKIRIALCSVVYRKALKLSKKALGETPPGKIVNLVANDVTRFSNVSFFLHYMWAAPLLSLIVGVILYSRAGYAGLIGISITLIVVPIQAYSGKLASRYRLQTALKTDERVRLIDEVVSNVQLIKMNCWEKPFCKLMELSRCSELKIVKKNSFLKGIYMTLTLFTSRLALYSTVMGIILLGENITAEKVFVFSSFFHSIAITMTNLFAQGFGEINETLVAVRRLQNFLTSDEVHGETLKNGFNFAMDNHSNLDKKDLRFDHVVDSISWAVVFNNFTAVWEESPESFSLQNIELKIERGKLCMVVGLVGSGKSSLLSSILREMSVLNGDLIVNGTVSYADQDSWVFNASVRENILFGQEFDSQKYLEVTKACALLTDFQQLPHGDKTLIGERGSSLSGGQRARINLARAIYRQADIYLLDDPLSAVDVHVGKHLFEECLQKYLKDKTRILATHQLQFIKGVDLIILVDQRRIWKYSSYVELIKSRPEYGNLILSGKETDNQSTSKNFLSSSQAFRIAITKEDSKKYFESGLKNGILVKDVKAVS